MPGDFQNGMLEDLCMFSVADQPVMECIDLFFQCIDQKGYTPKNRSKSRAHIFWRCSLNWSKMSERRQEKDTGILPIPRFRRW
ncbi:UNVERIFIED_ORG: hypothetical protein BDK47_13815 [Anoxybacillus amylolyticus]